MASKLDIWNMALSHIGDGDDVDDINEESLEAQECARHYPLCLEELLERHAWPFAIKTEKLTLLDEDAPGPWTYRYALPKDSVRPLQVIPNFGTALTTFMDESAYLQYVHYVAKKYQLEADEAGKAKTLVTNEPDACLRFIFFNEITGMYSPGFVVALSHLLASRLAGGPILKSRKEAQNQLAIAEAKIALASSFSGQADGYKPNHIPTHLRQR